MTMGSRLLRTSCRSFDALMVERMKAAGCIVIGKTNVPEFGLGSHTFNESSAPRSTPYDHTRTAGGSSGGAAVALAHAHAPGRRRQRLHGLVAQPGGVEQRVRVPPESGSSARAVRTRDKFISPAGHGRPDGSHGASTSRCCSERRPATTPDRRCRWRVSSTSSPTCRHAGDARQPTTRAPRGSAGSAISTVISRWSRALSNVCVDGLGRLADLGCA